MTDLLAANPGLRLRAPLMGDAEAVTALVNLVDEHDFGVADLEAEDVRQEWSTLDLERDAWHLLDGETLLDGDVMLRADVEFRLNLCVHPAWRRRGLGSLIMQRILDRARERIGGRARRYAHRPPGLHEGRLAARLRVCRPPRLPGQPSLLPDADRHDRATAPPPDGIEIRTSRLGLHDRATFDAVQDAFADHWGFLPMEYEDWRRRLERPDFRPAACGSLPCAAKRSAAPRSAT